MEETKRSGMSKDQFWNLIEKAKEVCGTDLDASAVWIKQQLFYMTPEDVLQFHNLVYSYRDAAYKYGLWTAASIMMEAGCSDDSFSDFRMWLIAQGKEVYLNALKDPDSLSGVTPYGYCSFESLGYISSQVYSVMKGKNIYQDSTARMQMECYEQVIRDIVYLSLIHI